MKLLKTLTLSIISVLSATTNVLAEVTYQNNLDDEFESFKQSIMYVTSDDSLTTRATLGYNNSDYKSNKAKSINIFNPKYSRVIGNCYGYDYSCTLMFKFDNSKAQEYKFKANVENSIYSLESYEVARFLKNSKSAKIVQTKINGRLFTFDLSEADITKIEF